MKLRLCTIGLAVALIGCASQQPQWEKQMNAEIEQSKERTAKIEAEAKARREAYAQAHPEYGRWILSQ